MATQRRPLLIIGSGPAGYTAAIYAARAALKPLLVQGTAIGGQLSITTDVENYPGFAEPIMGPWLMEQMLGQARHVGTDIIQDSIVSVDLSARPFTAQGDSGDRYLADSLIIATGAQAKWLGLDSEAQYRGFGVSACATCDGFFYRDRRVAVVGGGNTAVEEALYLTHHAERVFLVHRRDALRAEKILQERLLNHPKIEVIWNHEVTAFLGDTEAAMPSLNAIRLQNRLNGRQQELAVDGCFVAIGHSPATELFSDSGLEIDGGYLVTAPDSTATNIPGVFAAGDVSDPIYRQAVTAAGMGCMAALEAERFLARQ